MKKYLIQIRSNDQTLIEVDAAPEVDKDRILRFRQHHSGTSLYTFKEWDFYHRVENN